MKYRYKTVRSVRKSISISISAENKITVRCPWEMHEAEIEKFLDSKENWIEKVVLQNSKKLAVNDDVIEFHKIYVGGEKLPLLFSDKNAVTDNEVFVKSKQDIRKLYINTFFEEFKVRVDEFARLIGLYPASVSVRDYTGRWGCCDAKNNLTFNYKLFMLPLRLQDYVIVHELCHTLCHNHSHAFWKLVEEALPNYKDAKAELKNYDFLTTLY